MDDTKIAKPIVKWAGGKRKLLNEILSRAPAEIETYYEPFAGGAAVFFALANQKRFKQAVLNDLNLELVETYDVVKGPFYGHLIEVLKTYQHSREFYNHLRKMPADQLSSILVRAARFLYLNRTGFNGLYRVNKKGEFNVPFGKYSNPTICNEEGITLAHEALQNAQIVNRDFTYRLDEAKPGDFVYFDPPYLPVSKTSNFTSYTAGGFTLADHRRLAEEMYSLRNRGVKAILSNSDVPLIRETFKDFTIEEVRAPRSINSNGKGRGLIGELLIST